MSAQAIIYGKAFMPAYGACGPKQLRGFPPGKVRLRMRYDSCVVARVKTASGIREFYVDDRGDHWAPGPERGRNQTVSLPCRSCGRPNADGGLRCDCSSPGDPGCKPI